MGSLQSTTNPTTISLLKTGNIKNNIMNIINELNISHPDIGKVIFEGNPIIRMSVPCKDCIYPNYKPVAFINGTYSPMKVVLYSNPPGQGNYIKESFDVGPNSYIIDDLTKDFIGPQYINVNYV